MRATARILERDARQYSPFGWPKVQHRPTVIGWEQDGLTLRVTMEFPR